MRRMRTHGITPILNVSDLPASFTWFEKLGWKKGWEWCPPDSQRPTFGAVVSDGHEIFLCLDGQGGRGASGVWMAIMVDDVDAIHRVCAEQHIDVTFGPQDQPWGMREMHVRHPDGHMFRIGHGLAHEHEHDHEHDHDHDHAHTH
jgi:hypothetical protein